MKKNKYIGVDLGGTKILTAAADEKGKIISEIKLPTETKLGMEKIKKNIFNSIYKVIEKGNLHKDEIRAIGVGSPGPLNTEKGIILNSSNLPIKNMPIIDFLENEFNISARLENDANTAALGENVFGAGKDAKNLLYITISTGIGGGIIINNNIYYGQSGNAGEIGHIIINPNGPKCGCGNNGCLEAYSSGTAIKNMAEKKLKNNNKTLIYDLFKKGDEISAEIVAKAARKEDKIALDIYSKAAYYLGIGLANLVNIFNPEMIILGGGVMKAKDLFLPQAKEVFREKALKAPADLVKIREAELGDQIGVKGAIAVAMQKVEG